MDHLQWINYHDQRKLFSLMMILNPVCHVFQDNNFIVSSSEAGEMCTWDLVDGKCRESVKLSQVHTNIQVKCTMATKSLC